MRTRRTWGQRLLIALNIFLILVCLAGSASLYWAYSKVHQIDRVDLGGALRPRSEAEPGGVRNFLVVGVDSGEGLDADDPVAAGRPGGLRSDTIMVVRLDPKANGAAVLSIPRDLYVPIAGRGGRDRINSAIQGGPQRLVSTIVQNFGIPIDHYVGVNFAGFEHLVEALDGVPIYFPNPARDRKSFLDIPEAGCVTLDPAQALAFVRSRSFEEKVNGRWRTDGTGDFGRISRQQQFIKLVLQRAVDKGARNPLVLNELVDSGVGALQLGPNTTPQDLIDLGNQFRDFSPEALVTYSIPGTSISVGGASVVRFDAAKAEPVLAQFRGGEREVNANAFLTVRVSNGTGIPDQASHVAQDLRGLGYLVPEENVGEAGSFDYERTEVWYNEGFRGEAQELASKLAAGAVVKPTTIPLTTETLLVITGADYAGLADRAQGQGPTPTTSNTEQTDTSTSTSTSSTTSTTLGVVPEAPEGVRC